MTLNDIARLKWRYWEISQYDKVIQWQSYIYIQTIWTGKAGSHPARRVYAHDKNGWVILIILSTYAHGKHYKGSIKTSSHRSNLNVIKDYNGTNLKNYKVFTSLCTYGIYLRCLESGEGQWDKWFPKPEKWDAIKPYTIDCYVVMGLSQERSATPQVTTKTSLGAVPIHELGRT